MTTPTPTNPVPPQAVPIIDKLAGLLPPKVRFAVYAAGLATAAVASFVHLPSIVTGIDAAVVAALAATNTPVKGA